MTSPLRLAALSLLRRRGQAVIALVAIALPVAAGGVLLRLYDLSQNRLKTLDASFGEVIGAKTGELDLLLGALDGELPKTPDAFPANLYDTLRSRYHLVPLTYASTWQGHRVVGTSADYWTRASAPVMAAGRLPAGPGDVALSAPLAGAYGVKLGDPLGPGPDERLTVVGIFQPTGLFWDQLVIGDLADAQAALKAHVVHYLLADGDRPALAELEELVNHATVAQAVNVTQGLAQLRKLTGEGANAGLLLTGMILLLGALAVAGIMVTRFDGMLGQLAVLRALGYSRRQLAAWLLLEGLLLGTVAVAVGAGLDALGFPVLRHMSALVPDATGTVPLLASLPVWLLALATAVAAAAVPLALGYRHDVHRTMR